jgi:fatty-acyl-CoA synthase
MSLIDVTPSAYRYPLLIKHLLHTPLRHAPEQEIVYRDLKRLTYRELRGRIGRLASALSGLGVRHGDTVAVMDWDSHRYLECFFGVPMMGAVLMTVNVRLSPEQIVYTLNHARPRVLLVNEDFLPVLEQIGGRLSSVEHVVFISDRQVPRPAAFVGEYEALLAAAAPDFDFPDFDENTRATTFYTTGTTGLPKGVYFSHRQLIVHTLAKVAALALSPEQGSFHRNDVYMPMTPMFHVHAWGNPYISTMVGVKQVYPGRYLPEVLIALKQKEGVTYSHCVPTILQTVLSHPSAKDADLSGWKIAIGGSALPTGLAKQALARGMDVFTGYGMSETCPTLTIAHLKPEELTGDADIEAPLRARTGLPLPLVDLRVVDESMKDVPHDGRSTGEVVVRAPWLTQGYLKDPEASERLWRGGYLHTGDIGHISPDGWLRITDRVKDVIKTGGEWISSLELEDILSRHPAVAEVAVVGVKDEKWGERPLALVVPRGNARDALTASTLKEHVMASVRSGAISKYAVPERVLFVDAIEKTSVGKLDKKLLREKYSAA